MKPGRFFLLLASAALLGVRSNAGLPRLRQIRCRSCRSRDYPVTRERPIFSLDPAVRQHPRRPIGGSARLPRGWCSQVILPCRRLWPGHRHRWLCRSIQHGLRPSRRRRGRRHPKISREALTRAQATATPTLPPKGITEPIEHETGRTIFFSRMPGAGAAGACASICHRRRTRHPPRSGGEDVHLCISRQ